MNEMKTKMNSNKLGKSYLDFSARWIRDFGVSNRVEGDGFNFSATLKFLKWKFQRKLFARSTHVPNKTRVDSFHAH